MMKTDPSISYKTGSYKTDLLERLRDPAYASGYLSAVLEDYDEAAFQLALRDVAEAQYLPLPATPLQWNEVTELLRKLGLQLRLDLAQAA